MGVVDVEANGHRSYYEKDAPGLVCAHGCASRYGRLLRLPEAQEEHHPKEVRIRGGWSLESLVLALPFSRLGWRNNYP